jgi:DNA-binding Lrp family transcriptional regulator
LVSAERRILDHLLIETIKQVGVSNFSLIARLTGLNPETVRYKIHKQLSRMNLAVNVNIDYGLLGFKIGVMKVKGTEADGDSWLDQTSYLTFAAKTMGTNDFTCLYAIPPNLKKKYLDSYEAMKQDGLIDDFEASEIFWVRYPPFRSEYYDFDDKRWVVDWQQVDRTYHEAGVISSPHGHEAKMDLFDLRILKRIQQNPTITVTRIAKEMKANPRTARYHYLEHIVKNKLILSFDVRWAQGKLSRPDDLMQVVYSANQLNEDQKDEVGKVFNRIPFTWLEAGNGDGYLAFLDIPITDFHETVRYVERNTEAVRDKLGMTMLDPSKTRLFKVPEEMFDKKMGWRLKTNAIGEPRSRKRSS